MKLSRFFFYLFFPVIIFLIITFCAFGRTLNSYFLEDDFGEVLYVSQIFSGDWQKVIANFTGNYMGIPTMKVYRPFLLLSLIADYAFWKTNASGYFATNILFLIGSATLLYLVLFELTKSWNRPRSIAFSLFSAALFAASPLHCESVSLMVGRVDIVCAFFYLLSLWCFIHRGNKHRWILTTTGVISFLIALLTKEMAIGLPLVLTAICFLFPDTLSKQIDTAGIFATKKYRNTIGQIAKLSFNISYPLWLSCALYFVIRYFALGTLLGGYVGSIGASQFSHILEKWTDIDTIARIIMPLNRAVFHEHSIYHILLFIIYFLLLVLTLTKLILGGISRRWLLLIIIWAATALAPIYQLWGLGFNLEGARFLFFLTIPMAIILPLVIFSPDPGQISDQSNSTISKYTSDISGPQIKMLIAGTIILLLLIILDTTIAAKNNIPWVHAGKQTRALLRQGQNLASSLAPGTKAIILGIPKEIDGAHVVYNGATFNFIMSPPFSKDNYADRFITFEPILFSNPDLINTSNFKKELLNPAISDSFLWREDKMTFEKLPFIIASHVVTSPSELSIPLPAEKEILFPFTQKRGNWLVGSNNLSIQHCDAGTGLIAGPFDINPLAYDYLEIEMTTNPPLEGRQISVSWLNATKNSSESSAWEKTAVALPPHPVSACNIQERYLPAACEFKIYRIPLSRYWRWHTNGMINYLWLEFPPARSIVIRNMRLVSDNSIVPKLSVAQLRPDNRGVYQIDKQIFDLDLNASQIKNAKAIKLEFSKANYFFENFESNSDQAVLYSTTINETNTHFLVNPNSFPSPGYYQIRAIGLSNEGQSVGEWSDPLTVKL